MLIKDVRLESFVKQTSNARVFSHLSLIHNIIHRSKRRLKSVNKSAWLESRQQPYDAKKLSEWQD